GIGTVLQDDPQLSVRAVETPRQPRRVIVDRHAQTPHTARVLRSDPTHDVQTPHAEMIQQGRSTRHAPVPAAAGNLQADPVWIFTADPPQAPFPPHVEAISLPDASGKVDLSAMLDELGRRRINELHVEAGAKLAGTLIAQELVDELLLYFAPCLLGDTARGMFGLPALAGLDARIPLEIRDCVRFGDDWRVIARIKSGSDHV
ncbi:MAG: RibD family protein, partial [Acidobacteriota bacterium]